MAFNEQEILTKLFNCAEKYKENLCGKQLLFIARDKDMSLEFINTVFRTGNFQHLTGVVTPNISAKDFFKRCLSKRLSFKDIKLHEDGTTILKLSVLPILMEKNLSANMLANYAGQNLKLYSEKIVGNINACIGFVKDIKSEVYVPNTVLKQDIRNISDNTKRIIAIFNKEYTDKNYTKLVYTAKNIDLNKINFPSNLTYLKYLSSIQ